MNIKLPDDVKALWTAALDSGRYAQCTANLHNGDGFCCLGVLATVKGAIFGEIMAEQEGEDEDEDEDEDDPELVVEAGTGEYEALIDGRRIDESELLQDDFAYDLGLTEYHQTFFSRLNDGMAWTVRIDNPLFEVARNYAADEKPSEGSPDHVVFMFAKHSFAEISAIIKAEF